MLPVWIIKLDVKAGAHHCDRDIEEEHKTGLEVRLEVRHPRRQRWAKIKKE
jgi:hypothetical protein